MSTWTELEALYNKNMKGPYHNATKQSTQLSSDMIKDILYMWVKEMLPPDGTN